MRRVKPEKGSDTTPPDVSRFSPIDGVKNVLENLLDTRKRSHFSNYETYEICFSVGIDVSVEVMKGVTEKRDPSKRLDAFAELLSSSYVTPSHLKKCVLFLWRTQRQLRPDQHVYLTDRRSFFVRRFINLVVPFCPLFLDKFMPNFSPSEKELRHITKTVLGSMSTVYTLVSCACLALSISGASSIDLLEIIAVSLVNIPVAWGAQAAREAMLWSEAGAVDACTWMKELYMLRQTPIVLKGGDTISGAKALLTMLQSTGSEDHLSWICQESPQHTFNKEQTRQRTNGEETRSVSIAEELEELKASLVNSRTTKASVDHKFNICVVGLNKLPPLLLALTMMGLPTGVRSMKGESNILLSTYEIGDVIVDILSAIQTLFALFFVSQAILGHADDELSMIRKWTR
jgi:hypothetical protein